MTDSTEATTAEVTASLYGDITGDDEVSISDVVLLNKYLVESADLSEQGKANADCNADGVVDASDSVIILGLNVQEYLQTDLPLTE